MGNRALKTLFIFNGIFVFAGSLLGPLYAVFVETFEKNILSVSLSWAAFLVSSTAFMIIMRKKADSILEKEYLLLAGYFVRAIVWLIFPSITTVFALIFLQIMLGLGEALGTPSFEAMFAKHLDNGKEIKNYTDWKLLSNILGAFGVLLGGVIVNWLGFNVLFYLMSFLSLISFVGILIKPRRLL